MARRTRGGGCQPDSTHKEGGMNSEGNETPLSGYHDWREDNPRGGLTDRRLQESTKRDYREHNSKKQKRLDASLRTWISKC